MDGFSLTSLILNYLLKAYGFPWKHWFHKYKFECIEMHDFRVVNFLEVLQV